MAALDGKVAIVTGGASGIGEATAQRFVAEGARVVITDRNEALGEAVAKRLGANARFIRHDVTSEEEWKRVIAFTLEQFASLEILVNAAGYMIHGTIEEVSMGDWQAMMAVHANGPFLGCLHAFPEMVKAGYGSIINISSNSVEVCWPQYLAYAAAKNSQHALTRSIASHCRAQNLPVRCNAILPGGIETPLVHSQMKAEFGLDANAPELRPSMDRQGRPSDLANAVLFLACAESRYVNGQTILVDGAMTYSIAMPVTPIQ